MIVFGGVANDTWELPLSGPNANVWRELQARGELPPAHVYGGPYPDSTAYDKRGHRLLLFVSALSFSGGARDVTGLWQLSLQGPPVWSAVPTTGDAPEAGARIAVDEDGNRLFAVSNAVWSMPLDAMGAWTRVAELPNGTSIDDTFVLAMDRRRDRLVIWSLGGLPTNATWAFSLVTNTWVQLGMIGNTRGDAVVFDEQRDRFIGHGANGEAYIASLASDAFEITGRGVSTLGEAFATGVLDAKRNRILYFGGRTNAVSSIDLDTFEWTEVVPQTRLNDVYNSSMNFAWDPVRSRVVAFGDGETKLRGLGASDDWQFLSLDTFASELASPVYDSEDQAIVSFGTYGASATALLDPMRLASARSAWESIDAGGPGPAARSSHVAVYDEEHHRMIIHGGLAYLDGAYFALGDAWALTLGDTPTWEPLQPEGPSPSARTGHVGIYDPEGQRMIIYGGSSQTGPEKYTDLWSLSLDDAPRWTELTASGKSPGAFGLFGKCSAVYDAQHRRMVVVSFSGLGAIRVFALELGDIPTWHEFCPPGITPSADTSGTTGNAVLASDGLFLSTGGASFRFNLETPYCEG